MCQLELDPGREKVVRFADSDGHASCIISSTQELEGVTMFSRLAIRIGLIGAAVCSSTVFSACSDDKEDASTGGLDASVGGSSSESDGRAPDTGGTGQGNGGAETGTGGAGTGGQVPVDSGDGGCRPPNYLVYMVPGCDGTVEPHCVSWAGKEAGVLVGCGCDGTRVTGTYGLIRPYRYLGECVDAAAGDSGTTN